jgi:hypothetical protein
VDFYVSAAVKYPWADHAYFMFPTAYYHYTGRLPEFARQRPANAGPLDTQFAANRDGITWGSQCGSSSCSGTPTSTRFSFSGKPWPGQN